MGAMSSLQQSSSMEARGGRQSPLSHRSARANAEDYLDLVVADRPQDFQARWRGSRGEPSKSPGSAQ
jgi:hypothetical protein